jgi:signal transduction histidine kinase
VTASVSLAWTRKWRSLAGGVVLGLIGWALLAVQVASMLGAPSTPGAIVVTTVIPLTLSVMLFTGGICIYYYDLDDLALQISAWTTLGIGLFALVLGGPIVFFPERVANGVSISILLVNVAAGGAVMGFLIGLYDARQRYLLSSLREEHDRTVGLSQRLSVLARILRHDLRNQLTVILGQADRLESRELPAEAERAATAIREAGEDLISISESIGQFSSILADPHPDQTILRVDLSEAIHDAVSTVRARHRSDAVAIETSVPSGVSVEASPFLPKALVELIENAIIHNDAAEPRVEIELDPDPDPGDEGSVEVRIADDGPGLPDDEIAIHERDIETQLDHSTGVGLWLVRWVVTASGGKLDFETSDAGGTIVRIRLPESN